MVLVSPFFPYSNGHRICDQSPAALMEASFSGPSSISTIWQVIHVIQRMWTKCGTHDETSIINIHKYQLRQTLPRIILQKMGSTLRLVSSFQQGIFFQLEGSNIFFFAQGVAGAHKAVVRWSWTLVSAGWH